SVCFVVGTRLRVRLIYLKGGEALIARRIAARQEHFMPESLLRSQFEALEEPEADERPIVVSIAPPPRAIVDELVAALKSSQDMLSSLESELGNAADE